MFINSILSIALVATSAAAFAIVPRATPATYREDILEPYNQYHTRYIAVGCQTKHNTQFFDDCCHPLKKGETLENDRKAVCKPSAAASSSASVAEPTSTVVPKPEDQTPKDDDPEEDDGDDDDDEPCDDGDDDDDNEPPASSPAKPPATTTTKTTSPTTTKKVTPKPTPTGSGGDFNTGGIATFFTQGGVAGACGKVHKDSDFVAALTHSFYGDFGKKSSNCGRQIEVISVDHPDRKVVVTAADGCPTCPKSNSLDLSTAAFLKLATKNEGIANIKWRFIS